MKNNAPSGKVTVIGLGFVGSTVATYLSAIGYSVHGVDILPDRVYALANLGISASVDDYTSVADADVVLVAVQTPVSLSHRPIQIALISVIHRLVLYDRNDLLVIIESTLAPGAMQQIRQRLQKCHLAHCPERIMPGRESNIALMDRVIGTDRAETEVLASAFYSTITSGSITTTPFLEAELVKVVENTYRDVQIAFANETAKVCSDLGADFFAVRTLVNECPGRHMLLPGAGVGGHCIPKDSWLLLANWDGDSHLIPAARRVNDSMPRYTVSLLQDLIDFVADPTIVVLGMAYLADSADSRNSPGLAIKEILERAGVSVRVHDPNISAYQWDVYEVVSGCNAIIIATGHQEYRDLDWPKVYRCMESPYIVVDGRNVLDPETAGEIGFLFRSIGRPISDKF